MTQQSPEVMTTRGGEEREARLLSGPLMRFELAAEAEHLRAERQYAGGDRNATTLAKIDWFRLTLVALRNGATFSETDQRGSVALQALEGRVSIRVADQAADIGPGELAVVAPGQPWEAVATAESLLLVHLAWPPDPASAER
jgi:quercetin dioxygenase-like cupin family protein